jgi:hypothetical protein
LEVVKFKSCPAFRYRDFSFVEFRYSALGVLERQKDLALSPALSKGEGGTWFEIAALVFSWCAS